MKTHATLIIILLSVVCLPLQGQDFRQIFNDFTVSAIEGNNHFKDSLNSVFLNEISSNWEKFNMYSADSVNRKPQPTVPSVATESDMDDTRIINVSETVDTLSELSSPRYSSLFFNSEDNNHSVSFSFYDSEQSVSVPVQYGLFHPNGIAEGDVADFWRKLSREDYSQIVKQSQDNRERLGYNDWAQFEWIRALSQVIYPNDIYSERIVFQVFFLNQIGLMAKIARVDKSLACLFASMQPIYLQKYTVIDTYRYYLANSMDSVKEVSTYRINYDGKLRPFDMRLKVPISLGNQYSYSIRHFHSDVFDCELEIPINKALVSFYRNYPQTSVNVYAQSAPDKRFSDSLIGQLKEKMANMDRYGMVNELLRFIQYDFSYKVDYEQFGYEKQFFCEENFIYESNDCEDRAILFSYLVRRLTEQKVVLLEFDNHVATAVRFDKEIKGSCLKLSNGKYYVCDPTFIGATVGMCIPEYVGNSARVFVL